MKNNQNHLKETGLENLEIHKESVDLGFFEDSPAQMNGSIAMNMSEKSYNF